MSTRSRLSLASVLFAALAATVVLSSAGSAAARPKIPKNIPHFVDRQMVVSASGTITYRWTYDNREKCFPGYTKTVEEEFRFNFPKRQTKFSIAPGIMVSGALKGGDGQLDVRLGNWATTNFCDPEKREPEPPVPTCKSDSTPLVVALAVIPTEIERGDDHLAPLSREAFVAIQRTKPFAQDPKCAEQRPDLNYEPEDEELEYGWYADPRKGIATGMNAPSSAFAKLGVGKTLKRRIEVGGGCGGVTASASAVAEIPPHITRCTMTGLVHVNVTRVK
jgi:hypothetical protein